jgi:hypothetical protein
MTLEELFHSYEPFDVLPEFKEGFEAYGRGKHYNPYHGPKVTQEIKAEAWSRGHQAGSRWKLEKMKADDSYGVILNFPLVERKKE